MLYSDYVAIVLQHLSVDAARRGLENFRARMIKNALVDLQRFIVSYRKDHTTTYQVANLQAEENGMLGNLPDGAVPSAFYIVSTKVSTKDGLAHPLCNRNRLDYWPWTDRQHLFCTTCDTRLYAYALALSGRMFAIHPAVNTETYLLLVWDGLKSDFVDGDTVVFPEESAEAVAAYVKWRILLEIDKNPALAQTQFAIWSMKRLALYRDQQEKQDAEKPDEEFPASAAPAAPAANF